MELKKKGSGFFVSVMLLLHLFHLPLLHAHQHQHQHQHQHPFSSTATALKQEAYAADRESGNRETAGKFAHKVGLKRLVSINRKGGGGGGGHGGGRGIGRGHSDNGDGAHKNGATVVPLYAASHHHGTNEGTHNNFHPSILLVAGFYLIRV